MTQIIAKRDKFEHSDITKKLAHSKVDILKPSPKVFLQPILPCGGAARFFSLFNSLHLNSNPLETTNWARLNQRCSQRMSMSKYQSLRRFLNTGKKGFSVRLLRKHDYEGFLFGFVNRYQSQWSKHPGNGGVEKKEGPQIRRYSSDEDDFVDSGGNNDSKWKLELDWLPKALEPAFQLYKWALPAGSVIGHRPPPSSRSLSEIFASIQRSKVGIQDWSLSDLTIGLYLIYLQQASKGLVEEIKGEQIRSEATVHDLIYYMELAKAAYKNNTRILAKISMLREKNVVKFVKDSSVLRPGYYVGIDERRKNVVLGIRGTHTFYDLITDVVSSSHEELTFEGYSTHFGTAEAARWFLQHEMETVKKCLEKHQGFKLRIVGHSLGGAIASLLAIMLRKKSTQELGFDPEIVTAIGFGSPPCVSRELAESCSEYVKTVVMQDDIIPRLSVGSLTRLRNEIIQTDWVAVLEKEDWKGIVDLVTNAKQVVCSVQDVARKLADYAHLKGPAMLPVEPAKTHSKEVARSYPLSEELVVPGSLYYLKRDVASQSNSECVEFFTLWKRHPGEHFQNILLSSNLISDHKCDTHIYALRDVLKGLPGPLDDSLFR